MQCAPINGPIWEVRIKSESWRTVDQDYLNIKLS